MARARDIGEGRMVLSLTAVEARDLMDVLDALVAAGVATPALVRAHRAIQRANHLSAIVMAQHPDER